MEPVTPVGEPLYVWRSGPSLPPYPYGSAVANEVYLTMPDYPLPFPTMPFFPVRFAWILERRKRDPVVQVKSLLRIQTRKLGIVKTHEIENTGIWNVGCLRLDTVTLTWSRKIHEMK